MLASQRNGTKYLVGNPVYLTCSSLCDCESTEARAPPAYGAVVKARQRWSRQELVALNLHSLQMYVMGTQRRASVTVSIVDILIVRCKNAANNSA